MSGSQDIVALINYYLRNGYYRHAQTVANEVLKKRSNDPMMLFWRAIGMMREGSAGEAVRELEQLMRKADGQMQLPVKIAALAAHRNCKVIDQEAVTKLETDLLSYDADSAPDRARLTAATLLWHLGETFEAKEHVHSVLRMQPNSVPALTLAGWLEIAAAEAEIAGVKFAGVGFSAASNGDPTEEFEAAAAYFDKATSANGGRRDLESSMGMAKLAHLREQHKESLDHLSQVIGTHAWFLPALVEKSLVLLAMGDWEQAVETAQRALSQADDSEGGGRGGNGRAGTIDALRVCALYSLSQESDSKAAQAKISELAQALDRHEPMNAPLFFKVSRPFARLAGRNPSILSLTLALSEKACSLAPGKAEYAAEYAYQLMLLEDYPNAMSTLKRATAMEEGSEDVMPYLIRCQIMCGDLAEAEAQVSFVNDMSSTPLPEMALNEALIAWRQLGDADIAISHLDRALETHMATVKSLQHDVDYFVKLNPDFLLEIGREYLRHCGQGEGSALDESSPTSMLLSRASKLLHVVTKQVPGLLDGQMLLAKAHFLRGDLDGSLRCCVACSKVDPSFAAAALLHAQILLKMEKYREANGVMEQVLSHNFAVSSSPLFSLVKARLLLMSKDYEEAERLLLDAIKRLPAPRGGGGGGGGGRRRGNAGGMGGGGMMGGGGGDEMELSMDDRCSMHMCLVEVYLALEKIPDASSTMSQAVFEFSGTPQEGLLTITNAKVEVAKGDVETALTLLKAMPSDSPHYHAARKVLAGLYLEHRNDKRMYAACHEEMAAANPSVSSYLMLGEAYMAVAEPEKAIAAFERALSMAPNDAALASRIGQVLVTTHEYVKAIAYYEDAVATDPTKSPLRYELAKLFFELKKHDKALAALRQLLGSSEGAADVTDGDPGGGGALLEDVFLVTKAYQLLSKVKRAQGAIPEATEALAKAKSNQSQALTRMRAEASGNLTEQQTIMAEVCCELAKAQESALEEGSKDVAMTTYREGLKHCETHEASLVGLARLQLRNGELDAAQSACEQLMRISPDSNPARMLLADILLSKSEFEAAVYTFEQMLTKEPANFALIAKCLTLLRRAGRLEEGTKFLKTAERSSARVPLEPGYKYCQGMLARYQNNPRAALRHLNLARRDGEWGEAALTSMIEIYLNPENETNWDDLNIDNQVDPSDAVRACDRLLRELPHSPRREVLSCYTLMAYKGRPQIEKASAVLVELLSVEKDYVPALVCLSQAYLMLKQAPKARNHLKRVAKIPFSAELVDDFERGWLMLADVYINGGKYDLAEELCWRCLACNKSCAKAWEFLGVVKEREMSYKDAASHYEKAWTYENEASAAVGYKLSFNYLKAKKYVEAIDVCHKVLTQYPDYPKIKGDVLEKAREALKP